MLQIIIRCETNRNINVLEIAEYFGVNLPRFCSNEELKRLKHVKYVDDVEIYGIILPSGGLNGFFRDLNIPLVERFIPIDSLTDWEFEDKLEELAAEEVHVICGYDYNLLYDNRPSGIGHVSIVLEVDVNNNTTIIYDPGPINPGYKRVNLYRLFQAIKSTKDGLWIISSVVT